MELKLGEYFNSEAIITVHKISGYEDGDIVEYSLNTHSLVEKTSYRGLVESLKFLGYRYVDSKWAEEMAEGLQLGVYKSRNYSDIPIVRIENGRAFLKIKELELDAPAWYVNFLFKKYNYKPLSVYKEWE